MGFGGNSKHQRNEPRNKMLNNPETEIDFPLPKYQVGFYFSLILVLSFAKNNTLVKFFF